MNTTNNTATWDNINEAIYDRLDEALPEFQFKRIWNQWQSTNVTKLDGREGKTKGQVISTHPGCLIDYSEQHSGISYWDYLKQRDGLDQAQTATLMQQLAGIRIQRTMTADQLREYEYSAKAAAVWELFFKYTKDELLNNPTPDSDQYKRMQEYLIKERKYTPADVEKMQLGMLTDWHRATEYIKHNSTYTTDDINEIIQCSRSVIGHSHQLIIPIRNRIGMPIGMAARNINWKPTDKLGKYLFNTGLKKGSTLHGLPHRVKNGRAIIVEGQLDAAIINARGYDGGSVGALGGKVMTTQQADSLLKSKATEVIICFDNEADTIPQIIQAIETIRQQDEAGQIADRIYIADLPENIKDADELLTHSADGLELFIKIINHGEAYYKWLAAQALMKYDSTAKTDINKAALIEDIEQIASKINSPLHCSELLNELEFIAGTYGIQLTKETLNEAAQRIRERTDAEKQAKQLDTMLQTATNKLRQAGPLDAINHVKDNLRNIEQRSRRTEFEQLYSSILTEDIMLARHKDKPASVALGYSMNINGETQPLEIPTGQLTFFSARTGHGKTKFMLNVALNILQHTARNVHFFTYEIDDIGVIKFALNIYLGEHVSRHNRKSINSYFENHSVEYFSRDEFFIQKKNEFFTEYINQGRFKICHTEYSADEMIQYIKHIRQQDKDAVIIIDYIQKLRSDRKGNTDHRFTELKFICEDLNSCAINTQLPIIMAAQFNREVQTALDMDATKLAEASDIEKIASEVYGIWDCDATVSKDSKVIKTITDKYKVPYGGNMPTNNIILEILKSRLYGPGHFTVLHNDWNTGKIKLNLQDYASQHVLNEFNQHFNQSKKYASVKKATT